MEGKSQKKPQNAAQGKPQNTSQGKSQNKQKNKPQNGSQDGKGLIIICAAVAVVVVLLLVAFIARGLGAGRDAEQNAETTVATEADDGAAEGTADAAGDGMVTGPDGIENPIYADITVEGYGTITVAMDASAAPITVENFIALAEDGFYDGLTFHRIIDGFMMQGGDPEGTGLGGADQEIVGEFSANGHDNPLSHTRGAISMARSQNYDSASSQFFIVQSDSTYLDGQYAAFGYVTSGMEYVDQICRDAKPTDGNGTIAKEDQPVITSIVIRREE